MTSTGLQNLKIFNNLPLLAGSATLVYLEKRKYRRDVGKYSLTMFQAQGQLASFQRQCGVKVGTSQGSLLRAAVSVGQDCLLQDFSFREISGGPFLSSQNWGP